MVWDEEKQSRFRIIRIVGYASVVAAPLIYLAIASIIKRPLQEGGEHDMMMYILLIVGVVQPLVAKFIEHFQITSYRNNEKSKMTPDNVYFTMSLIKFAFIECIYIYGLVVYLVSGNFTSMLYFYPIGIVWTFIYWPKKSGYEEFIKRMESNVPVI